MCACFYLVWLMFLPQSLKQCDNEMLTPDQHCLCNNFMRWGTPRRTWCPLRRGRRNRPHVGDSKLSPKEPKWLQRFARENIYIYIYLLYDLPEGRSGASLLAPVGSGMGSLTPLLFIAGGRGIPKMIDLYISRK